MRHEAVVRALVLALGVGGGIGPGLAEASDLAVGWSAGKGAGAYFEALRAEGHSVQDLADFRFSLGEGGSLSLGAIDLPIPPEWPSELREDWEGAVNACKVEAAPPPYGIRNGRAFLCGRRIAPALFQRYLDHLDPDWVVEVVSFRESEPTRIAVSVYTPSGERLRRLEQDFQGEPQIPVVALELTKRLLAGEGAEEPRTVARDLPRVSADQVPAERIDPASVKPVPWTAACAADLPKALTVKAADRLQAEALQAVWAATAEQESLRPRTQGTWACALDAEATPFGASGPRWFSVFATLTCPGMTLTHRFMDLRTSGSEFASGLATRTVKALLAERCGAAP